MCRGSPGPRVEASPQTRRSVADALPQAAASTAAPSGYDEVISVSPRSDTNGKSDPAGAPFTWSGWGVQPTNTLPPAPTGPRRWGVQTCRPTTLCHRHQLGPGGGACRRADRRHFATGTNWAPAVDIAAPGGGRLLKDRSVFTGLIASDAWGGVNHPGQDQNRRRAGRLALSDGVGVEWKPSPRQASASARRCSAAPTPACAVPAWPRRRVVGAAARAPATTRV
jgi:hypothetical protein